ncbi:hypothetical protein [Saccharothrix lopnurensis]|uniref:Uncharacterized protein n=1 Tax=Saccharothrix lopnurensis TaxID=1670621 RepID=A0ABW1PC16_9PSEU
MDPDEVRAFPAGRRVVTVATIGPNGDGPTRCRSRTSRVGPGQAVARVIATPDRVLADTHLAISALLADP